MIRSSFRRSFATATTTTTATAKTTAKATTTSANVQSSLTVNGPTINSLPATTKDLASAYTGQFIQQGPGGRSSANGHTVTVFGCTGFLGRYLVNELGKNGARVIVAYRGTQESPRHLKLMGDLGQIVPLRFDIEDKESVQACIRHSDTVYNLIGRDYETRNFSFERVHVESARVIAAACVEAQVQRLIHVSSINADSGSKESAFYRTKGQGEKAVSAAYPGAIIVRPGHLYGWEDRLFSYLGITLTHPIKKYAFGGFMPLMNGGKRTFYPTYVGDVARGLESLIHIDEPAKLYEFRGANSMTYKDFCMLFCEYARRPFAPLSVPYAIFRRIIGLSQNSPLARLTVHDVDRQLVDDKIDPNAATLESVGVMPQDVVSLAIRFVRHYRSDKWVDQPASLAEVKHHRTEA